MKSIESGSAAEVMTLDETCALLRVSRPTVFELVHRGKIPGRQVGSRWRFHRPSVVRWLQGVRDPAERAEDGAAASSKEREQVAVEQ